MKNVKAIAGILLVFLLGAASGAIVTHMVGRARLEAFISGGPQSREDVIVSRLSGKLDLDNVQKEQVRAIVHETHTDIRQVRHQCQPQVEAMLEQGQKRISAILRPDQREKFDKYIAERKARRHHDDH
jgi:hypothetical protein